MYLKQTFPQLSDAKLKEGIFDSLLIQKLMHDSVFTEQLNSTELAAWQSFTSVVTRFLGTHKEELQTANSQPSPELYKPWVPDVLKNTFRPFGLIS